MARPSAKRMSRPREYRELLHSLNQRYKREWDRAEAFKAELEHIKNSRAYRFICWWRKLRRTLRVALGAEPEALATVEAPATSTPSLTLPAPMVAPTGTISVVIPFR